MAKPTWIGQTIGGRYEIEELLGTGGMSAVYKASDPNLRRVVAVKLIHPHLSEDPSFVRRVMEEAYTVSQLRHPNIIQIFDFNHEEDTYFIHSMSVKIIARMATIVAMWEQVRNGYDPVEPRTDLTHAENFLYMMKGCDPDPVEARIMDACLVLHAEHTINASTFTSMVTGSTLAMPFLVTIWTR